MWAYLLVLSVAVALSSALGCRRDTPGVVVVTLPDGGRFEVPANARASGNAQSEDERSFVVAGGALLEIAREEMKEGCAERMEWIENRTMSEIEAGRLESPGPMQRMTLGGWQAIRARLSKPASGRAPVARTEMIGVCAEDSFVIFQVGYSGDSDPELSTLLTSVAKSLRY